MPVPNGVIFLWVGNTTLPSGWTKNNDLASAYIQGAPAGGDGDLVTVRGQATHTHTSPDHTPIQNSHTHSFSGGSASVTGATNTAGANSRANTHTHGSATSASATAINDPVSITVDAATNDLAFVTVAYLESDGTPTGVPDTACGYFEADAFPAGWSRVYGDSYVLGVPVLWFIGGITGGSDTHTHTSPAHTHTQVGHVHADTTSGTASAGITATNGPNAFAANNGHTHLVSFASTTATNQSVTTTLGSSNFEPVYKKVNMVQNGTGGDDLPVGIVGLWGGTDASIPVGWERVTGLDGFFPKNANANGESMVTTGGSTTHTHTASDCQPTQDTHTHTATGATAAASQVLTGAVGSVAQGHTHVWTVVSTIATNNAIGVTIDANTAESAYPNYRRVIFIRFAFAVANAVPQLMVTGYGV